MEQRFVFDSPVPSGVRKVLVGGVARLGFTTQPSQECYLNDDKAKVPDLFTRLAAIPGSRSLRRCLQLYCEASATPVRGDVIEVGAGRGRCTAFLAQACEDTDNGVVHAIDRPDVAADCLHNVRRVGLDHRVKLYAAHNAREKVAAETDGARMIFAEGPAAELDGYAELLAPGGVLLFDDAGTLTVHRAA